MGNNVLPSKQFIETINADDLINADQDNVNYLINAELHQCIKAARDIPNKPYNFEVELVSGRLIRLISR